MPKRSEKRDTAKAEYIAKKKKGEEVSLRALAGELGVSYQTLRNWKAADKWEEALPKKKRGGQPGNQRYPGGQDIHRESGRQPVAHCCAAAWQWCPLQGDQDHERVEK